jgi:fluoride exporter
MPLVLIAIGGALGSVSRYLLGSVVQRTLHIFPAGTFVVNVLGCLAIGWLYRSLPPGESGANMSALAVVGFCGGFTTFSTFSLETVGLINGGETPKALAYVALSAVTCAAATALGMRIAR